MIVNVSGYLSLESHRDRFWDQDLGLTLWLGGSSMDNNRTGASLTERRRWHKKLNWQSRYLYGEEEANSGDPWETVDRKHRIPFFFKETWIIRRLEYLYPSLCQFLLEGAGIGDINSTEHLAACPEHREQAPLARESLQQRIIDAEAWKCFKQAWKC